MKTTLRSTIKLDFRTGKLEITEAIVPAKPVPEGDQIHVRRHSEDISELLRKRSGYSYPG